MGLEECVKLQSAMREPKCVPSSVDEGNKCPMRAHNYSGEPSPETVNLSEKLDPFETSACGDDRNIATSPNVIRSEFGMEQLESSQKNINFNDLGHKCIEKPCALVYPETVCIDGNPSISDSLNTSERNKYIKCNAPVSSTPDPPSQGQSKIDNDGSDELVDVRVCDICGDVGRETLLALCCKCSDGAEHIYCMRIKTDKVPEGDWVCEDCMMMQDPKRQKQTEAERLDSALVVEVSEVLPTMNPLARQVGEMRASHSSKGSSLSSKRPGFDLEASPVPKKRFLERNARSLKISNSGAKASLTRASSLKIINMGKEAASQMHSFGNRFAKKVVEQAYPSSRCRSQKSSIKGATVEKNGQPLKFIGSGSKALLTKVSSLKITDKSKVSLLKSSSLGNQSGKNMAKQACLPLDHRSTKPHYHFPRGDDVLGRRKLMNYPDSTVQVRQPHNDVNSEKITSEGTSDSQLVMKHPRKKLFKSKSFSGINLVPSRMSNAHFSHTSNFKDLKYSDGRNSIEKYDSTEKGSPVKGLPVASCSTVAANTFRTTSGSKIVEEACSVRNNVQDSVVKVGTSRTTSDPVVLKAPCSLRNNVQNMKAFQVENANVKVLHSLSYEGQMPADTLVARHVGENMSSHSSCVMSSSKNANSHTDLRASELRCSSRADDQVLVASNKVPSVDFHPTKELPSPLIPSEASAVPKLECIWKGGFDLEKVELLPKDCRGIQAHLSSCASSNVVELIYKFQPKIFLKEVRRLDIWPGQFQRNHPTEQDIAVYFFAEDLQSYLRSYKGLLDSMVKHDLALEADFDGVKFLVFPSSLLPPGSRRWNALSYLWGVFRGMKVDNCNLQSRTLNVGTSKQGLESVDPMTLLSSVSTKTIDQSGEHEVSSMGKCLNSRGSLFCQADMAPVVDDLSNKKSLTGGVLQSDDFQKGDEYTKQATRSFDLIHVFPYDKLDKENVVSTTLDASENVLYSNGNDNCQVSSSTWNSDPSRKKRLDVVSWSSFSADSGPSLSSDGGGCAKLDEGQVEQLQYPANYGGLNLDLCLASGSEPEQQVDLDLVLGFSGSSKYQHEHCRKGKRSDDGQMSSGLSRDAMLKWLTVSR